jgi:hypothetical protein
MELFITGPSPDVDLIAKGLRDRGHTVISGPPSEIRISSPLPLSAEESNNLSDDVLSARGDRLKVPLTVVIGGEKVLSLHG